MSRNRHMGWVTTVTRERPALGRWGCERLRIGITQRSKLNSELTVRATATEAAGAVVSVSALTGGRLRLILGLA